MPPRAGGPSCARSKADALRARRGRSGLYSARESRHSAVMDALIRMTAREVVARLAKGEVSPLDLIDLAEKRIAETDGAINALPTHCFERARAKATALMQKRPASPPPGYLHGLPVAIKDLAEVAGVRTTFGSPIYADHVPARSDLQVEILEAHGATVVAKSNTPEFGAGAQTFNEVFGTTTNPWNTALTPGGSSGGAAAALAAGQVWLASGSDLGGSLRIPAAFCGVVGLRPSPGRVAHGVQHGLVLVEHRTIAADPDRQPPAVRATRSAADRRVEQVRAFCGKRVVRFAHHRRRVGGQVEPRHALADAGEQSGGHRFELRRPG